MDTNLAQLKYDLSQNKGNDAFLEFELEVSPVEGQSLQQKDKKRKKKGRLKKIKKQKTLRWRPLSRLKFSQS